MPEYSAPGVYVEEIEIGAKPIEGVSTSTAGFVGIAEKGPLDKPELVDSMGKFTEIFGDFIKDSYLAYSVAGFFENGGKKCYVVRIAGEGSSNAYVELENRKVAAEKVLMISAVNEGKWGKNIKVEINESSSGATFLYSSSLQEDTESGNNFFKPTSRKGLSVGEKVKLSDGVNTSNELTITGIEDGKVLLSSNIGKDFSKENTRVMVVITANAAHASFSTPVKSSTGFEKGDLVSFVETGEIPIYVNLSNVSFTENKITWQGRFKRADGTARDKVEGAKFVDVKRVELEFTIGGIKGLETDDGSIALADINEDAKSKIRKGDIITFGKGPTAETVTVKNVGNTTITFSPKLKNPHSIGEKFKAITAPQAKVYSKSLSPPLSSDNFDTGVKGFKKDDTLVFSKNSTTEAIKIKEVKDTEVTLVNAPTISPDEAKMLFKKDSTGVVVVSPEGFKVGDLIEVTRGTTTKVLVTKKIEENRLVLKTEFGVNNTNASFLVKEWKTTDVKTVDFGIEVKYEKGKKTIEESFNKLSLNSESSKYVEKEGVVNKVSKLIKVKDMRAEANAVDSILDLPKLTEKFVPLDQKGEEGIKDLKPKNFIGEDRGKGDRTGLVAFEAEDKVNILCMPDIMSMYKKRIFSIDDVEILQSAMISHCEKMKDRFAVLDSIKGYGVTEIQAWKNDNFDSKYAALYYPWIKVMDPISAENGNTRSVPPSGYVAGIYARSDTERGVHKAPANEFVKGAIELELMVTRGEQENLNPDGINCIRAFPGRGIRVWGARTISSDTLWKDINVRRLFLFLEESIEDGTQWVVFEPNNEKLWARVRQTITQFLTRVLNDGALMGTTPEEAFFVRCDRTTMTDDDITNGRLIILIGVRPVYPAEVVIFRIAQWPGGSAITE